MSPGIFSHPVYLTYCSLLKSIHSYPKLEYFVSYICSIHLSLGPFFLQGCSTRNDWMCGSNKDVELRAEMHCFYSRFACQSLGPSAREIPELRSGRRRTNRILFSRQCAGPQRRLGVGGPEQSLKSQLTTGNLKLEGLIQGHHPKILFCPHSASSYLLSVGNLKKRKEKFNSL